MYINITNKAMPMYDLLCDFFTVLINKSVFLSMKTSFCLGISDSLDAQVLSMMYQTENQTWRCSLCGKESRCKRDLWGHIESLHIENHPGYSCNYCGIHVKTKNALRLHVNRKHPVQ